MAPIQVAVARTQTELSSHVTSAADLTHCAQLNVARLKPLARVIAQFDLR